MKHKIHSLRLTRAAAILGLACLGAQASIGHADALPPSTTIPVYFTHTIKAGKAKPGDPVTAISMQTVNLPGGQTIPKGTMLVGHVVASQSAAIDPRASNAQKPSVLSIRFDRIAGKDLNLPVNVSVRALANDIEANEASRPQYYDVKDGTGFIDLVGGDAIYLPRTNVVSNTGEIVGRKNSQGVLARLIENDYVSQESIWHCDRTDSEQSIGIFSPRACGVYGYGSVYMPSNGSDGSDVFTLETHHGTVQLNRYSAALLQVNRPQEQESPEPVTCSSRKARSR
jgi:hypothetical protein